MRWIAVLALCVMADAQADPRSHYLIHCMGCHLMDGSGNPPDVPAFGPTLNVLAGTDDGRAYLVQVPGAAQSPISDAALADVINWMVGEFGEGRAFAPFAEKEVAHYRRDILADPVAARARILAQP